MLPEGNPPSRRGPHLIESSWGTEVGALSRSGMAQIANYTDYAACCNWIRARLSALMLSWPPRAASNFDQGEVGSRLIGLAQCKRVFVWRAHVMPERD